ncbi:hypothetical protein EDC56_0445 [Sinobacterium caligoides]|uniref:Uncharacterized protein n=1 Tax=Sinobacterium caligoides TaxID=933926 RepID=A0A3N2DYM9_9GAMM|nr:hypothetical protein [Sinobacterium caligoides]ROS04928.1 hypothetical protein EDC56_0445 [Sinobacterium caligoides]
MDSEDKQITRAASLNIVQRGNLKFLESQIREHWCLGQNIVLCWHASEQGVELLLAPHYFLAQFSAALNQDAVASRLEALNGLFIKKLISGRRQMSARAFQGAAKRLQLEPIAIELPIPVLGDSTAERMTEELLHRYSISYVDKRAVILFDIVDFSLFTPFEQTSQLNSLSYSINSSYHKLLKHGIEVNFTRTTTGDGFYIWNRDNSAEASLNLYLFMLLVVMDNAIAQRKARGNTVPAIRTGFHMGSHYEFYQAEGLNPTMFSYIVGDVTIELSRMLDGAHRGQIVMGDFTTTVPTSMREGAYLIDVDTPRFIERIRKQLPLLKQLSLSGENIEKVHCYLTGETGASGGETVKTFTITDKHGLSRKTYNVRINIHTRNGQAIILGMQRRWKDRRRNIEERRQAGLESERRRLVGERKQSRVARLDKVT